MLCAKKDCFYCVNGKCVSISVLSVDKCGHFLAKKQSRARNVSRPLNLSALRAHLDAHAPIITASITGTGRLERDYVFI